MQRQRMHPDGVAALVAVITAPTNCDNETYSRYVDYARDRVLRMARRYYQVNPQDFQDAGDWMGRKTRNALQNLAKLNRANLR